MGNDLIKVLEKKLEHYSTRLALFAKDDRDNSSYKCAQSRVQLIEELLKENEKYDMVTSAEMEEFGRRAFYAGRELKDPKQSSPGFKRPTFNGFLRELDEEKVEPGVYEKLIQILELTQGLDGEKIEPSDKVKDDLGLDSLDIIEFGLEVEKEFNIQIEDHVFDALQIGTVKDMVGYINLKL